MRHIKRKRSLKPSSYILLSEFAEATRLLAHIDSEPVLQDYERICSEAEAKLDALALTDPEEATRIYQAYPKYFDEAIDVNEVYLGHGVFCDRSELKTLDTPEKRAAYIKETNFSLKERGGK